MPGPFKHFDLMEISLVAYPGPGYGAYPVNRQDYSGDDGMCARLQCAASQVGITLSDKHVRSFLARADVDAEWCLEHIATGQELQWFLWKMIRGEIYDQPQLP